MPPVFADSRMGCDVSKSVDVIDNNQYNEDEVAEFTETQIDTIRSTWPLLAKDLTGIGAKVFFRIFIEEPKVKLIFKEFSDKEEMELLELQSFRDHVTRFMQVVDLLVDSLDCPKVEVQQTLMMLGARHATFEGFDVMYFNIYSKCLLEVWETTIGEEFILEVKECWSMLFAYIVKYICQGYEIMISEYENPLNEEKS